MVIPLADQQQIHGQRFDIIFDEHNRTLQQRHRHWVQEVWGFPGGIVQSGETLEEAFAFEVFEETNLAIADIQLIRMVCNYRLRLEICFLATLAKHRQNQRMRIQEQEIIETHCFPLEELPSKLLPLQKDLIENIISSHLSYV